VSSSVHQLSVIGLFVCLRWHNPEQKLEIVNCDQGFYIKMESLAARSEVSLLPTGAGISLCSQVCNFDPS
jgi:hypothetical protein